jgi:tRNA threonylcarbamoyladenosine biosynthesis protein TsaB
MKKEAVFAMPCLIIDTSTDLCLVALAKEDRIVAQEVFQHSNLLSKNLLTSVQALMQKSGLAPSDLSSIAAGIGPGSYTGTRLGAAVAKTLAFGLNIPVKAFSSPLAFLPERQGSFAFVIPARSGVYFLLKGSLGPDFAQQESSGLIAPEALEEETKSADFFIFPTLQSLPEALKEKPCFEPSHNLPLLCRFLAAADSSDPENVELQYLHTPF